MYLKVAELALLLICKGLACRIRSHHSGITLFKLAHKYSRSVGNKGGSEVTQYLFRTNARLNLANHKPLQPQHNMSRQLNKW